LTFDDAITVTNYPFYDQYLNGRKNPNGANISATFFVTHEYNDYHLCHQLWRQGHEISLHSITHQTNTQYWSNLNESMWKMELVDQIQTMSYFANIPADEIKGVRVPFLQMSGDETYKALSEGGFEWECSRPTWNQRTPGLWPYTNDFLSTQDCQIAPCPTKAFPGFWTFPMIDMIAPNAFPCAMLDECNEVPSTSQAMYDLLLKNFNDQYNGNRAPYGIYTHAAYFIGDSADAAQRRDGYAMFLDYLATLKDVYIVSVSQALEWVRNPTAASNITNFAPWQGELVQEDQCLFPRTCTLDHMGSIRYMKTCQPCPTKFPWLGNPLGQA
jgi:peptidoglycan/xylan/chitin deacetylase (PgdA/CDA1 family)